MQSWPFQVQDAGTPRPNKADKALMILTGTEEVTSSNLCQDND